MVKNAKMELLNRSDTSQVVERALRKVLDRSDRQTAAPCLLGACCTNGGESSKARLQNKEIQMPRLGSQFV
jgi:hypothetical protein